MFDSQIKIIIFFSNKLWVLSLFRIKGDRFYFLSNEERRIHVHVICGDGEAKFWIEPIVSLAT